MTYDDESRAEDHATEIAGHLAAMIADPTYRREDVDEERLAEFSARRLAGQLAQLFDQVVSQGEERG